MNLYHVYLINGESWLLVIRQINLGYENHKLFLFADTLVSPF